MPFGRSLSVELPVNRCTPGMVGPQKQRPRRFVFCGERGLRLLLSPWCHPRRRLGAVSEELVQKLPATVFVEESRQRKWGCVQSRWLCLQQVSDIISSLWGGWDENNSGKALFLLCPPSTPGCPQRGLQHRGAHTGYLPHLYKGVGLRIKTH